MTGYKLSMTQNIPKISLISSLSAKSRAMGKDNKLLWRIPYDLKQLKKLTTGHVIIMGRKTYESIGHPLPNRVNIILTRDENWQAEGCIVVHSIDEALEIAREKEEQEIFIFGGEEIFRQTINIADKLYLTIVEDEPVADTFFPDYSWFKKIVKQEEHEYNGLKYRIVEFEK